MAPAGDGPHGKGSLNPRGKEGVSDPKAQHGCAGCPACTGALTQFGPSVAGARGNPRKERDLNPKGKVRERRQSTLARHAHSTALHNSRAAGPSPWKSFSPSRSPWQVLSAPWLAHGEAGRSRGALSGLQLGGRELRLGDLGPFSGLVSSCSWGSSPLPTQIFALYGSLSEMFGPWVRALGRLLHNSILGTSSTRSKSQQSSAMPAKWFSLKSPAKPAKAGELPAFSITVMSRCGPSVVCRRSAPAVSPATMVPWPPMSPSRVAKAGGPPAFPIAMVSRFWPSVVRRIGSSVVFRWSAKVVSHAAFAPWPPAAGGRTPLEQSAMSFSGAIPNSHPRSHTADQGMPGKRSCSMPITSLSRLVCSLVPAKMAVLPGSPSNRRSRRLECWPTRNHTGLGQRCAGQTHALHGNKSSTAVLGKDLSHP